MWHRFLTKLADRMRSQSVTLMRIVVLFDNMSALIRFDSIFRPYSANDEIFSYNYRFISSRVPDLSFIKAIPTEIQTRLFPTSSCKCKKCVLVFYRVASCSNLYFSFFRCKFLFDCFRLAPESCSILSLSLNGYARP